MAIDASIYNRVQLPDFGRSLTNGLLAGARLSEQPMRNELLNSQVERSELSNDALRQQISEDEQNFMLQDMATDAIQIKKLAQTDPMQAQVALAQRIKKIRDRDGDPSDTIAARQLLIQGRMDEFMAELDAPILAAQQRGLLGGDPGAMTIDQALRSQELNIKKDRLTFDQEKAKSELKGLQDAVDALDIPEEDKGKLKGLPADTLSKIVTQANSPKARADKVESADKAKRAEEATNKIKNLVMELLKNRDGLKRVIGGFDELTPTLRPSSRDAEAALEDLRNLLTVENLDLMSGVLSESDIKILKSVGASGLSGSQDRVLSTLEEMDKALNGGVSSVEADNGRVGRFRVRAK